ncbi:alcohol dehydrogenase catalytic domain-containing protein, partial [Klebsiella pneumoniae]|nr:alcohol dehydrogenase catalytic domain-containing protein [Klebsiella pneumoniae]
GKIEDLYFGRVSRRRPGPGEIEILVHHAALNYKDLLKVLGQIADEVVRDTYFGRELGMESAGVVVATGEGVTRFKPGDQVIASVS